MLIEGGKSRLPYPSSSSVAAADVVQRELPQGIMWNKSTPGTGSILLSLAMGFPLAPSCKSTFSRYIQPSRTCLDVAGHPEHVGTSVLAPCVLAGRPRDPDSRTAHPPCDPLKIPKKGKDLPGEKESEVWESTGAQFHGKRDLVPLLSGQLVLYFRAQLRFIPHIGKWTELISPCRSCFPQFFTFVRKALLTCRRLQFLPPPVSVASQLIFCHTEQSQIPFVSAGFPRTLTIVSVFSHLISLD